MRRDIVVLGVVMAAGSVVVLFAPVGPYGATYIDAYYCVDLAMLDVYGDGMMGMFTDVLLGDVGAYVDVFMHWCETAQYVAYALDAAFIAGAAVAIIGVVLKRRPEASP